jgi:hypothetical protein
LLTVCYHNIFNIQINSDSLKALLGNDSGTPAPWKAISENTEAFVDPMFLPEVTFSDNSKGLVRINDPTKMSVDHQKACLKKWYEIGYFEMRLYKPRNRRAQEPFPADECWWAKDASDTGPAEKPKRRKKQKN